MEKYDEMRLGIAAIVSPLELPYIQEWVDWHREIGFTDFYICMNDWHDEQVAQLSRMMWRGMEQGWFHIWKVDGLNMQVRAYNQIMRLALMDGIEAFGGIPTSERHVDWRAFIDIDEFIKIRSDRTLPQILNPFRDVAPSLALNWRLYGSSGLEKVENGNYSVLERFKKCGRKLHPLVKQIVNLKWWRERPAYVPMFMTPHSLNCQSVGMEWEVLDGPLNNNNLDVPREVEVAHYVTKSRQEFLVRRRYRRADTGLPREDLDKFWAEHDVNEIEEKEIKYEQI